MEIVHMSIHAVRTRFCRISLAAALLSILVSYGFASDALRPVHIDTPPIIDGRLDDPAWRQAPYVTGFRTFYPDFGKMIPESTVVYMAYDRENLYFAFHCFDPHPSLIKAEITNRDNILPHDFVCLNLDSFNDQQALYALYVNPLGIQMDSRWAAGVEDFSVDVVWYSAGRIVEDGYIVEMQIPRKSIRYSDKSPVEMSLFFERRVSRTSVNVSYPELDPGKGLQFLTQMKPIVYPELEPYNLFEILPAITYTKKHSAPQGELVQDYNKGEASLTTKYGITSDLILDGTYNPDFSQIEADAGQVDANLRFGLFFPEKRSFFLEGSEVFTLAATSNAQIVHTRTIVNPLLGVKLSGKLSKKSTLAALYAIDETLNGSIATGERVHIPIMRYKYTLSEDSYLGGIYTGRELPGHSNRVIGVDGFLRVTNSSYLSYQGLFSRTATESTGDETDGHALSLLYGSETRDLDYTFSASKFSEHFSAEVGYVTRLGVTVLNGLIRPKIFPASETVRRIAITLTSTQTRDDLSALWETWNALTISTLLGGSLNTAVSANYSTEVFSNQRFQTSGFSVSAGGQLMRQLNLSLVYRNARAIYFSSSPYQGRMSRITTAATYQPWNQFEASFHATYVDFYRDSDGGKIYEYPILRSRLTYQLNQYLFFRSVLEYNKFRRTLLNDLLVSFTYIPGTVMHLGYGSLYQRLKWEDPQYVHADDFLETRRGLFIKMSYLWRM